MKIESKYDIGQKVIVVYRNRDEIRITFDVINEIVATADNLYYVTRETYSEIYENDVILYGEKDKLLDKIEELMKELESGGK